MNENVTDNAAIPVPAKAVDYESPFAPLINELYRNEVLDARRMSPEEKLILGERLFRWACAVTIEGIKCQNPGATEEKCRQILRERLELAGRMEVLA